MNRRKFIGGGLATLVAAYLGQKYLLNDPTGKFLKDTFGEKPIYEGNINVGVGKFFSMPDTGLTGVVEKGFDSSKLVGKLFVVYGKERKDLITQKMTGFVQVDRIKAKDGSEIYKRTEDKKLIGSDFPSDEPVDKDKYLSPKITYKNEDAWKKLGTNKIKLTGTFSPDYEFIYVRDEKDGETDKIRVGEMDDWVNYKLQSKFYERKYGVSEVLLKIYAIIKNTVDAKERIKTRELFTADVNYILPEKL